MGRKEPNDGPPAGAVKPPAPPSPPLPHTHAQRQGDARLDAFAAGLKKRLNDALLGGTVSDYQGYGIDLDAYIDAYLAEFKGKR